MAENRFDVIVIGSGPGGEGAAMQLAKGGKRVGLVEKYEQIGGGCTHWNTIPSKALRFAIFQLTDALNNPLLRRVGVSADFDIADLRANTRSVIHQQQSMRQQFYLRNDVTVVHGHARFLDNHHIDVEGTGNLRAEAFVIATGSRPYRPPSVDFSHPRIFDSDTILKLDKIPKTLTVYGAGVVGCEYTSMFRNLNVKISLVNGRDRLLDYLDDEISDALSYHMRERGVVIRHSESFDEVAARDDSVVLSLKSGKQVKSEIFLWANGRTGNTDQLGVDNLSLAPDSRGYLEVNEHYQTEVDNIYAVGDVIGFPSLASAAYTQGRLAALHALGSREEFVGSTEIPAGIYTSPEISSIGKTERELTEARIPYEVGHAQFKQLAFAQITGAEVGMLKILFHRESLQILGVHCFGPNAAEIVHIGQAIMAQKGAGNSLKYFIGTTFNYPTMAEAYRVAALNGYNRLF